MTENSVILALRVEAATRALARRIEAYRATQEEYRDHLARARYMSARTSARILVEQSEPGWR